jgi:hypothetical protein
VPGKKAARMGIAGHTGAAEVGVLDIVRNEAMEGVVGSLQDRGWGGSQPASTLVV